MGNRPDHAAALFGQVVEGYDENSLDLKNTYPPVKDQEHNRAGSSDKAGSPINSH
jgi:hypothetical protein